MDASIVALAEYESLHSTVNNSIEAQAKAVAVATTSLTVKLAAIQAKNPDHSKYLRCQRGMWSFGSSRGKKSSLLQGSSGSIVKLENHDGATYWSYLNCHDRTFIGPDAIDIYDATTSKFIANHVEHQVQLHIRDVIPDNVKILQVEPGAGGWQGLPPYKVGARLIMHNRHGNLPLGAILKSEIPPGTAHISEKPASKKRSLMDYFKS